MLIGDGIYSGRGGQKLDGRLANFDSYSFDDGTPFTQDQRNRVNQWRGAEKDNDGFNYAEAARNIAIFMSLGTLAPAMAAGTVGSGAAAAGAAEGATAAGAGTAAAAGSYAIPTAAELSAAGFGTGGMGMTGAAGIGSASSVVGAGAGAAGYGSGIAGALGAGAAGYAIPTAEELTAAGYDVNGMGMTGANGIGAAPSVVESGALSGTGYGATAADLAESYNPNYSHEGDHYPTPESTANSPINANAPDLQAPSSNFQNDLIKNIAKQLLKSGSGTSGTPGGGSSPYGSMGGQGGYGGMGGYGNVLNAPANETPNMIASQAAPQQQQALAQALLLGNPEQPQFNGVGYMPVPQSSAPNAQMMALAKALQGDDYNG